MEFPIVVVGSLTSSCKENENALVTEIVEKFTGRTAYEPKDEIKYFDFWRLYYTAFSRAESLLVLTNYKKPNKYLSLFWEIISFMR